jgi:histidine triad (HIT) family protein
MPPATDDPGNLSAEQIADAQKQNCVFCRIIAGEIPTKKLFEDDKCIIILDINPASEGHCLIIPKKHYQIMPQIPEAELGHFFCMAKKASHTLLKTFGLQGTTVFVANGVAAGQKAPHFMIHVIPRTQGDALFDLPKNHIPEKDLEVLYDSLSKKLMPNSKRLVQKAQQKPAPALPAKAEAVAVPNNEHHSKAEFHDIDLESLAGGHEAGQDEKPDEKDMHEDDDAPLPEEEEKDEDKDVDIDKISKLFT